MRRTLALFLFLIAAACTARPPVPTRVLQSWLPQEDALSQADPARLWRFSGQAGDVIHLRLTAKPGGEVLLELQDTTGTTLVHGDDLDYILPANGIYTASVRLTAGAGTSYSLTLTYPNQSAPTPAPSLTPSPTFTPSNTPTSTPTPTLTPSATFTPSPTRTPSQTPTPSDTPTPSRTPTPVYAPLGTLAGRLEIGGAVDGSYLSQFERHIYLFAGTAGTRVTIAMTATSGTVDPVLTLFDPSGKAIATDDNSGGGQNALLRDLLLTADGDYVLQALGGGTGGYTIHISTSAPPIPNTPTATPTPPLGTATPVAAAEELADHVPALGIIERGGGFNRYFIQANAGEILTVGVRAAPGSPFVPRLEIYTPSGELLFATATLGLDGQVLIPNLGVIETGKYGVFVSAANRATGAYVVAYGRGSTDVDNVRGGTAPEAPVAGSGLPAVRDTWTLPLAKGDVISADAHGAALQVVAPDGKTVARAESSVQFSAPLRGDYRVYASGQVFSFVWRYVVAAPTPSAPLLILSADDDLPPHTYLDYPFQAEGGVQVHIRVEAQTDGLDPVAALLDPSGSTIASGDDSAGSLNPDFGALLPANGTYDLRVNGYGDAGGSVNVTVELLS